MKDKLALENQLCEFFKQYKQGKNKNKLPKKNTALSIFSNIKNRIKKNNAGLDISSETDFPRFNQYWKGYKRKLKSGGKGDTTHNPEINTLLFIPVPRSNP